MKLIIIEGPDRIGKTTLIKNLCEYFNFDNITIRHFGKPPSCLSFKESLNYQLNSFKKEAHLFQHIRKKYDLEKCYYNEVVIWNRSHLGEYVYSSLYRNGNKKTILKRLLNFETKELVPYKDEIYLITMITDDIDILLNRDDGLSFSKKTEDRLIEIKLFEEIHSLSLLSNKLLINVDNDPINVLNKVINFI